MAELRWVLLLAGLVFLLALTTWELRRAQRARRAAAGDELDELPPQRSFPADRPSTRTRRREPTLELNPELDPQRSDHGAEAAEPQPSAEPAVDSTEAAAAEDPHASAAPEDAEATDAGEPAAPAIALASSTSIEASQPLRVEWPDEHERRILSVRIVAAAGDRLAGRAVRQALGACGFVHGPYRIYHQPAVDGRALLSCANLTKPGDFDPLTLDFQRLTGLSLFALLPGPVPPDATLEHLLGTAYELAQRLRAELTDDRGLPLNEAQVEALRATVRQWMEGDEPEPSGRPTANGRASAESMRGA